MTADEVRRWLLAYAWLGTPEEKESEVACIMSQDGWRYLAERADRYAGAQAEPGPKAYAEGHDIALSGLYECHDAPHLATCPRFRTPW